MRTAFLLVGIGWAIVIVAGAFALRHHSFTQLSETGTGVGIISSSTNTTVMASSTFLLASPDFGAGASIPSAYTCDSHSSGTVMNPPLSISGAPRNAISLALIMDDPDVPKQILPSGVFDHWVLFNIPASTTEIATGATIGTPGKNGAGQDGYAAPCPPTQYEPSEHRYVFTLYALDRKLSLESGASKGELVSAMQGHIITETQLIGRYKHQ